MKHLSITGPLRVLLLITLSLPPCAASTSLPQESKPKDDRGLGVRPNDGTSAANQTRPTGVKPEIVLQAGITSPQSQISFSPDGRLLATMGINATAIKLWEIASGRLLRQFDSGIPSLGATSLARPFRFSPDGRLLIAMAEGKIRRWEIETGREASTTVLPSAKDIIQAFLSNDGRILAAIDMNRSSVRLWDTTVGREPQNITFEREDSIASDTGISLSPTGALLAVLTNTVKVSRKGAFDTTLQISLIDVSSGRKAQALKVSSAPTPFGVAAGASMAISFSGDGAWVALRDDSTMKIWEVSSGRELKTFASPKMFTGQAEDSIGMYATKFLISPDHRLLSLLRETNKIDLIDAASGAPMRTLQGHNGIIISMSFSSDSKLLATSGLDNQVKIWDAETGREVRSLSGSAMPISDLAFSRDGKSLSLAGYESVSSWELTTGGVKRAVTLPDDYARHKQSGMMERGARLSHDGRFVIAGSSDQPVAKVWEVASGRELPGLTLAQGKELGNAAFSGDGNVVALVERDPKKNGPASQTAQQPTNQSPAGQSPPAMAIPDMTKIMEQMQKDPKKMQEMLKKAQEAMKNGDMGAGMAVLDSMGISTPGAKQNQSPRNLRLLDVATGRQLQSVPLPTSGLLGGAAANTPLASLILSFSPDGRTLASATGMYSPITLRDVATGKELRTLKSDAAVSVYCLAWSADGRRLASGQAVASGPQQHDQQHRLQSRRKDAGIGRLRQLYQSLGPFGGS